MPSTPNLSVLRRQAHDARSARDRFIAQEEEAAARLKAAVQAQLDAEEAARLDEERRNSEAARERQALIAAARQAEAELAAAELVALKARAEKASTLFDRALATEAEDFNDLAGAAQRATARILGDDGIPAELWRVRSDENFAETEFLGLRFLIRFEPDERYHRLVPTLQTVNPFTGEPVLLDSSELSPLRDLLRQNPALTEKSA